MATATGKNVDMFKLGRTAKLPFRVRSWLFVGPLLGGGPSRIPRSYDVYRSVSPGSRRASWRSPPCATG